MNSDILIYCINLTKNTNRRNVMESQFLDLNLKYLICKGIDSSRIIFTKNFLGYKNEKRTGEYNFENNNFLFFVNSSDYFQKTKNNGHLGCLFSHLHYLNDAYKKNINYLLMCEDDISFEYVNRWEKSIDEIINNAPKDWNIIKLHCSNLRVLQNFSEKEQYVKIPKDSVEFWSTGLYLINKNGIKKIINKYYLKEKNTFFVKIKYPVADFLIQQIDNVYYYSIPIVKNNNSDHLFKSDVTNSKILVKEESKGIKFVESYYSN